MFGWINRIRQAVGERAISFPPNLFSRNGSLLFLQFAGLALAFASNILLARLFGDTGYGLYALVSGWAAVVAVPAVFGVDDSHMKYLPGLREAGDRRGIARRFRVSLRWNAASTAVVLAGWWLAFALLPVRNFHANEPVFRWVYAIVPALVLFNNALYRVRGLGAIVPGEAADKIARPLFFAGLAFALWKLAPNASAGFVPLAASAAGIGLVAIVLLALARRAQTSVPDAAAGSDRPGIAENFRFTLLNLLYMLSMRLDILLTGLLVAPALVGHYTIASRYADIFGYPITMLNLSFPLQIAAAERAKGREATAALPFAISRQAFRLCAVTGLLFSGIAPFVFSWYGKSFGEAFTAIPWLLLATLLNAAGGLTDVFFLMTGRERQVIVARLISLLPMAVTGFLLIPRLGIRGAALSVVAGMLTYVGLIQAQYFRLYGRIVHPFAPRVR